MKNIQTQSEIFAGGLDQLVNGNVRCGVLWAQKLLTDFICTYLKCVPGHLIFQQLRTAW